MPGELTNATAMTSNREN